MTFGRYNRNLKDGEDLNVLALISEGGVLAVRLFLAIGPGDAPVEKVSSLQINLQDAGRTLPCLPDGLLKK